MTAFDLAMLDRRSVVPLYYQLQEVLKHEIESGRWQPGDALPSEPDLCRRFRVSRMVVRQALAILQDDRQIVRERGRGTFVAKPKLHHRAGGLVRLLEASRPDDVAIRVLDVSMQRVEASIRRPLRISGSYALRITTQVSLGDVPVAIGYSYFDRSRVDWLERCAVVGARLPTTLTLADHGIELGRSQVAIETSQCGQFEADRFGVQARTAVFLVLATEYERRRDEEVPLEVARVEYRGDLLQFRLELADRDPVGMAATLALNGDGR